MIKEIYVKSFEDLIPLFMDQTYQPSINRYRSTYIYRGVSNATYSMVTSLTRNCKDKAADLEEPILNYFARYSRLEEPNLPQNIWSLMIAGQHHGLPTRLLDFSHSPLVALQFAAVGSGHPEDIDKHDCAVTRVDMAELHSLLPGKYRKNIGRSKSKVFTLGSLSASCSSLAEYDEDMGDHAMVVVEPPSVDQRIINQYSFFAVVPTGIKDVDTFLNLYTENTVKYIISKDLRWEIADKLDSYNISERMIYPGLDGLSRWIGRHYYVR